MSQVDRSYLRIERFKSEQSPTGEVFCVDLNPPPCGCGRTRADAYRFLADELRRIAAAAEELAAESERTPDKPLESGGNTRPAVAEDDEERPRSLFAPFRDW